MKAGLLLLEAEEMTGDGLKEVCKALGIAPVLHMGSCVDCSRILVLRAEIGVSKYKDKLLSNYFYPGLFNTQF